MPLSWLPVISDYTKDAENPLSATAASAIAYTIASLWMYFIGVEIVGIGTTDVSQAILISGLGVQGVIILVLSTVTTNFLATNSAGESAKAIFNKFFGGNDCGCGMDTGCGDCTWIIILIFIICCCCGGNDNRGIGCC